MPDGHGRRLVLKPDELLVVLGKAVGELLPPALLRGVLGQPEQELPVRSGDLVVVEQPLDLPAPPYRGASRRDHRAFLLLGAARADQCDGHADFSETCALSLLVPTYSPIVTMTAARVPAASGTKSGISRPGR